MDILAINRFNKLSDDQFIFCCSGVYQYQGHRLYTYPAYSGFKKGWYDYYKTIADINQWHSSILNGMLHQIIASVVPMDIEFIEP